MKSSRVVLRSLVLFALVCVICAQSSARAQDPLPESIDLKSALADGEGGVHLRYRIEHAQDHV